MERIYQIYQERTAKLETNRLSLLRELVGLLPYAFINQTCSNNEQVDLESRVFNLTLESRNNISSSEFPNN